MLLGGLPVIAAGRYAGPLADAIRAVKRGERAGLEPLALLLAAHVRPAGVLVPAVTLRGRAAERGFDQARELARRAAARAGVAWADVLVKHGSPQQGRRRTARLGAVRFSLRPGVAVPARALLVDDVVTTGATLRAAAAALAAAGCSVAGALVVAAAPPPETQARAAESVGT